MPCTKKVVRRPAKQGSSSREGSITSAGSASSTGRTPQAARPLAPAKELPGLPYNPLVPRGVHRRAGSAAGMDQEDAWISRRVDSLSFGPWGEGDELSANRAGQRAYYDASFPSAPLLPFYRGRRRRPIGGRICGPMGYDWVYRDEYDTNATGEPRVVGDNFDGLSKGYGEPTRFGRVPNLNDRIRLAVAETLHNRYEDIDRPRQQAMDRVAPYIRDRQRYRKFKSVERQLKPDGGLVRAMHKSYGKSKAAPDAFRAATLKKLRRDHRQIDSNAAWAALGAAPGPSRPPRVSLSSSSSMSTSTGSARSTAAGRAPRRPAARPRKPARPTKRRRG